MIPDIPRPLPDNGPMQGVRMLELSSALAVPLASAMLADQGAEVIKIEPLGMGDILRWVGHARNGVSAIFQNANRGKRSLALDLKQARGLEICHQLVADSDVLLHNFRPGVAERLGIGYQDVLPLNERLIYLSINGYGLQGPKAGQRAYDNVIQSFAGLAVNQANIDTGEPTQSYHAVADKLTATSVCQAVTAALFARERGRGGQQIHISMVDSVVAFLWPDGSGTRSFLEAGVTLRQEIAKGARLTRFQDGWGNFAPLSDAEFFGTCRAFGVDVDGDESVKSLAERAVNREAMTAVMARVADAAAGMKVAEAMQRLEQEDVPCAQAMDIVDLPEHPQMQANESFAVSEHPVAGRLVEPRNPPRFSATPSGTGGPSPALGEHSERILRDMGLDEAAIADLIAAGVVATNR